MNGNEVGSRTVHLNGAPRQDGIRPSVGIPKIDAPFSRSPVANAVAYLRQRITMCQVARTRALNMGDSRRGAEETAVWMELERVLRILEPTP